MQSYLSLDRALIWNLVMNYVATVTEVLPKYRVLNFPLIASDFVEKGKVDVISFTYLQEAVTHKFDQLSAFGGELEASFLDDFVCITLKVVLDTIARVVRVLHQAASLSIL